MARARGFAGWVAVLLVGLTVTPARAQVVINGVSQGASYTVPAGGVSAPLGESVGLAGTGTVTQTQGTNDASAATVAIGVGGPDTGGFISPGYGTYLLSGGTLDAGQELLGILGGQGTVTQTGGSNSAQIVSVLGESGNGLASLSGLYTLGGGTLAARIINVGTGNSIDHGSFAFNGGVADFASLNLATGGSITASGNEVLDTAGQTHATYNVSQTGGTNAAAGALELGAAQTGSLTSPAPITGTYGLSGVGSVSAGAETLGLSGVGKFYQTGGSNTITAPSGESTITLSDGTVQAAGSLVLGAESSGVGSYSLSAGSLSAGSEVVGLGGTGAFDQTGGQNTTASLTVAPTSFGPSVYTLGGGTLTAGTITVGPAGTFVFDGGAADFGTLNLAVGGLITASGNEVLDTAGQTHTSYNVTQTGGTNVAAGAMELGAAQTGSLTFSGPITGTYELSGVGSVSAGAETLGLSGVGKFYQTGGSNTITAPSGESTITLSDGTVQAAGSLVLGAESSGVGSYSLSAGSLSAGSEVVGLGGTGAFDQTGGQNTTASLTVAPTSFGPSVYTLGGGTLTAGTITVGPAGTFVFDGGAADFGTLNLAVGGSITASGNEVLDTAGQTHTSYSVTQTGGTNVAAGAMELGAAQTGSLTFSGPITGTYELSGVGSVSAGVETLGLSGVGTFVQTGGSNTITAPSGESTITLSDGTVQAAGSLVLGAGGTGAGSYTLMAGTLSAGSETVGLAGLGRFTQNGGTNTTGVLNVAADAEAGGVGSYTLTAGTLSAGDEVIGLAGSGTFSQTGGTNTTAMLSLAPTGAGASAYTLGRGGTLTAGTIVIAGGSFAFDGGTLTAGTIVIAGGSFAFDGGAADFGTLNLATGGVITASGNEVLDTAGETRSAYVVFQNGGTNTVTDALELGAAQTGSLTSPAPIGGYALSDVGSVSAGAETLGLSGVGIFAQNGGSNTITAPSGESTITLSDNTTQAAGSLVLGAEAGGIGSYTLTAGALSAGSEVVGLAGSGTFSQTGGTNTTATLSLAPTGAGASAYTVDGGGTLTAGTIAIAGGSFAFDGGAADFGTLNLAPGGSITASGNEALDTAGQTHTSYSVNQSGGSNVAADALELGAAAGDTGSYMLTAGALSAGNELVGLAGTAEFYQIGGSNTTGTLTLAPTGAGVSVYTLDSGTLTTGTISIAAGGNFAFNGGTADFGTLSQTGGSINATGNEVLDTAGQTHSSYTVDQSGGSNGVGGGLELGAAAGNSGSYTLSGGDVPATAEVIGLAGSGTFAQTGGSNDLPNAPPGSGTITLSDGTSQAQGSLVLGAAVGGTGTYTLSAGTLAAASEVIGLAGNGTFTQAGGSNTVRAESGATPIVLGAATGGVGTYTLSAGTLSAGSEVVGLAGTGTFTQNGGSNSTGTLTLAPTGAGVSVYTLDSGTLTTGTISIAAGGSFAFNGGTADFGTLSQTGGSVTASGNEVLDTAGQTHSSYTVGQSGGSNAVTGVLELGAAAGNAAFYTLVAGTLNAGSEMVGPAGSGIFIQNGGSNSTGSLSVGSGAASIAAYTLAGGTLNASTISIASNGSFAFNGGTVGFGAMSLSGQINASGNEVLDSAGQTPAAYSVTQIGGQNSVTAGALEFGVAAGNAGSYALNNAGLTAEAIVLGVAGTGTLTQGAGSVVTLTGSPTGTPVTLSTGAAVAAGTLTIGLDPGSAGTYNLQGGDQTGAVDVTAYGIFNLSGGGGGDVTNNGDFAETNTANLDSLTNTNLATVSGALTVGNAVANTGTLALDGGSIATGTGFTNSGALNGFGTIGGAGTFTNTANVDQIGGTLVIAADGGGGVGSNDNIGTIGLAAGAAGSLQITSNVTLTSDGSISFTGGSIAGAGALDNRSGTITGYGTIATAGGFTNNGLLTPSGGILTLSATTTNASLGEIDLQPGLSTPLQLGAPLTNQGLIVMNGGVIAGTPTVTGTLTNAGGMITGPGRIETGFVNQAGTLDVTAGLTGITQGFSNAALVELTGPTALLAGGLLNNEAAGTLEGSGQVDNEVFNQGLIEATGGTLTLAGSVINVGGTLLSATGTELVAATLARNGGTISLAGGAFDTSGATITNDRTISGYGTFNSGGLTNNATVLVAGGTGTFNGSVTNNAGATLTIDHASAVFNGAVTNNGTIHTIQGTASYAATFTNNGTVISDPSTQTFSSDLTESTGAIVQASAGDVYAVAGGFLNHSTQNSTWNTGAATLEFIAGGASSAHSLLLASTDLGSIAAGYQNDFAWGTLAIDAGQSLVLGPGGGTAFYTDLISGALLSVGSVSNITGNGFNIYYNPLFLGNAYLDGLTYSLADGGQLIADSLGTPQPGGVRTPEPGSLSLLGVGLLALAAVAGRRRSTRRTDR